MQNIPGRPGYRTTPTKDGGSSLAGRCLEVTSWALDLVALVLALGLSLLGVVLILVATIVQILYNDRPEVSLSGGTPRQILKVASVGAFSGLLGGYVGYSMRDRRKEDDQHRKATIITCLIALSAEAPPYSVINSGQLSCLGRHTAGWGAEAG